MRALKLLGGWNGARYHFLDEGVSFESIEKIELRFFILWRFIEQTSEIFAFTEFPGDESLDILDQLRAAVLNQHFNDCLIAKLGRIMQRSVILIVPVIHTNTGMQ